MNKDNFNNQKLNHLGIIMDGNGRWATKNSLKRSDGHQKGLENIENICRFCIDDNIKYLTLFSLSKENYFRPTEEVLFLMKMFEYAIENYMDFILKNNIIFNFLGDINIFNENIVKKIKELERQSSTNANNKTNLILNIAFNYGGKQEILNACKKILENRYQKLDFLSDISEKEFRNFLYLPQIPDPDLIIRTGGYQRLSNFLIFQSSYSELYFCDDLFPDFNKNSFKNAIEYFVNQKRNFGLINFS
jgi:undecaprenyl diphosphate synthase